MICFVHDLPDLSLGFFLAWLPIFVRYMIGEWWSEPLYSTLEIPSKFNIFDTTSAASMGAATGTGCATCSIRLDNS